MDVYRALRRARTLTHDSCDPSTMLAFNAKPTKYFNISCLSLFVPSFVFIWAKRAGSRTHSRRGSEYCLQVLMCIHYFRWSQVKPLPGANRLVKHLHKHGVPLALASNSVRKNVHKKISYQQGLCFTQSLLTAGLIVIDRICLPLCMVAFRNVFIYFESFNFFQAWAFAWTVM